MQNRNRRNEQEEVVPITEAMAVSLQLQREWREVEQAREAGELPPAEASAYQEGLLRSMEVLNDRLGITIDTLPPGMREELGQPEPEPEPGDPCPECGGGPLVQELGTEGPFCPDCGR